MIGQGFCPTHNIDGADCSKCVQEELASLESRFEMARVLIQEFELSAIIAGQIGLSNLAKSALSALSKLDAKEKK